MSSELNLRALVRTHLEAERKGRLFSVLPWAVVGIAVFVALITMMGARNDLWTLPIWRLVMLGGTVLGGLVLFPAMALGTWFPSPAVRVGVAVATSMAAVMGSIGLDSDPSQALAPLAKPCVIPVAAAVLLLAVIATRAGAFTRRSRSAFTWLATALAASGIGFVATICPTDNLSHVVVDHLLSAVVVSTIVVFLARLVATRGQRKD